MDDIVNIHISTCVREWNVRGFIQTLSMPEMEIPADQIANVSDMTALLHLVEEEANALMNLNPNDYTAKKQRRGQWKWWEVNSNTTQEISGFLVAEISKDSCVSLLGNRFHQSFTGVSLSEEYGTWSDNVNAESKG